MAEVIEEMQERLLPEYEMMKNFNVCTAEQLKEIIHKRRRFQTRITKNKKSMQDFLDFIIFERKFHKLVCEKEQLLGKKLSALKASIAKRIVKLYRQGLQSFPHEERLWFNYIQFAKKSVPHEVAAIYERMLMYYGDNEKIWCDAALWTYEYSGNMAKVKEIFHRALLRHPRSGVINKSFFDVLLADAAKMSDERNLDSNTKSEQDFSLEILRLHYTTGCKKHISDLGFYFSLLERCETSEYANLTMQLQKEIIEDLMEIYANQELLWDFLAQRELRGFSTTDLQASKNCWQSLSRTEQQRIELCCQVYETAVATLQSAKMMELYIVAMLKLDRDNETEASLKRKCLAKAFKLGYDNKLISDAHLALYLRMLLATQQGTQMAKNILENEAPSRTNLELYELWLNTFIAEKNFAKVSEIFQQAHKAFKAKSLPLWQKCVNFYEKSGNSEELAKIRQLNL